MVYRTHISNALLSLALACVVITILLSGCDQKLSEERIRMAIPGTWVGTFASPTGTTTGSPQRLEMRIFGNGQYQFLVQGADSMEIRHAGTWSVKSNDKGTIGIVGTGAPGELFEVVSLGMLHLRYRDTTITFTRQ